MRAVVWHGVGDIGVDDPGPLLPNPWARTAVALEALAAGR